MAKESITPNQVLWRRIVPAIAAVFVVAISMQLTCCSSRTDNQSGGGPDNVDTKESQKNEKPLSLETAQARAAQVASVNYTFDFTLEKGSDLYGGIVTIDTELKDTSKPLRIDHLYKELQSVVVNGADVTGDLEREKGSYQIPATVLKPKTQITVTYRSEFNKRHHGFMRFVDTDGLEYLATDFEPYAAHDLFPCFDQPDLKAHYSLSVTAPKEWVVISNTLINQDATRDANKAAPSETTKRTVFNKSEKLSTYLFFLGAGNYWSPQEQKAADGKSMNIYVRQSLKKFLDYQNIFDITKKGLVWFEEYFGVKYPFQKYDHIFVADFEPGAMENAGAVTMNERLLPRSPRPPAWHQGRENTILHEMAHMWFGDLVTMEWWNDLWLNESFATFISYLAQSEISEWKDSAWQTMMDLNGWAFWQDQLPTTHPIEGPVANTDVASSIFDGITYAKGSASLKQLQFYVGEEKFQKGMQIYFQRHAWGNTKRSDFIAAIAEAAEMNLDKWVKAWLQTEGLNQITPSWKCEDGKVSEFSITQTKTVSGIYLPHRTKIGLYKRDNQGNLVREGEHIPFKFEDEKNPVAEAIGRPCPAFVFANDEYYDYGIYFLDETSFQAVTAGLDKIVDTTTRQAVWMALEAMVDHRKLRASDFYSVMLDALRTEKDDILLAQLFDSYNLPMGYYWWLSKDKRAAVAPDWEALSRKKYIDAHQAKNEALYLVWLDFYIDMGTSAEAVKNFRAMLEGDLGVKGEKLPQDKRWVVIQRLASLNAEGVSALIDEEKKADSSDFGKRQAIRAEASIPTLENKRAFWQKLISDDPSFDLSDKLEAAAVFHDPDYPEFSKEFAESFFVEVEGMNWAGALFGTSRLFKRLFPSNLCNEEFLAQSKAALEKTQIPESAKRAWIEENHDVKKCMEIRSYDVKMQ